ncbi:MAG: sulfatase [Deltaproteobacteria bacterium]|nr:sulfatase [Deltaproteobacteria bacterium]
MKNVNFTVKVSKAGMTGSTKVLFSVALDHLTLDEPRWNSHQVDLGQNGLEELTLCFGLEAPTPRDARDPASGSLQFWVGNPRIRRTHSTAAYAGRPSLLLITLDTTRGDHISAAGYPLPTTPRLDTLAGEGELFTNAVANSSWTLPTHASLFTGLYPSEHGADTNPEGEHEGVWKFNGLNDSAVTLAEQLLDHGYQTAGITAGPMVATEFGLAQGFQYYNNPVPEELKPRTADEVTDLAIAWLEAVDAPYFLFLNYFDPHWPYRPPPDLLQAWVPPHVSAIPDGDQRKIWEAVMRDQRPIAAEEKESMITHYDGEIAAMDRAIGRLIDWLREHGQYNSALVVAVGDHAESFGEHYMVDHGQSLYEDVVRVPLIIKYPNLARFWRRGRTITDRVDQLDVYATICRQLDLALPKRLDSYGVHRARRHHFAELKRNSWFAGVYGARFDRNLEAVYEDSWKLIRDNKGNHWLFALGPDPLERANLAEVDNLKTRELAGVLDAWKARVQSNRLPATPLSLSPERTEQLRALGYIGGR